MVPDFGWYFVRGQPFPAGHVSTFGDPLLLSCAGKP